MSNFVYDAQTLASLCDAVSAPRLAPYLTESRGDIQIAIDLYVWNIKAAARLYGPLSIFEVTLRNALSREMALIFRTHDWIDDPAFCTMAQSVVSASPRNAPAPGRLPHQPTDLLSDIRKTKARVTHQLAWKARVSPMAGYRTVASTDDVVAALDLGFWTKLLNRDLHAPLFLRGLHRAFPNAPRTGKYPERGPLSNALNGIRTLRNRVMHFEPLFHRDLAKDIENVVITSGLIDRTAAGWIEHHSEFEAGARDRTRPRHYF